MAIALMVYKEKHTAEELQQLAQAPYFGTHLVRVKEEVVATKTRKRASAAKPAQKTPDDRDFLPSGTPVRSHGIAPSTRQRFETLIKTELPTVNDETLGNFMEAQKLRALLKKHPELKKDDSVSQLYELLKIVSDLGFRAGWYEDLQEKAPKGWR